MLFTEDQINKIIPDEASLKAAKGLADPNKWTSFYQNRRVLWGEIKGSGSNPYLTQIDLQNIGYKCSCPSRKFPCKHGLGLMLLISKLDIPINENEPAWVKDWIDKRHQKSESLKVEKNYSEEDNAKQQKAKLKREDDRNLSVEDGIAELRIVLCDWVRVGLINLRQKEDTYFKRISARLVDAKASGLANMINEIAEIRFNKIKWEEELLKSISQLFLLIESYKNINKLDYKWQCSIKNLIGWNQSTKELIDDENALTIKDSWFVIGQENNTSDDNIITQKNWLIGLNTNQSALIINFSFRSTPIESIILPGTTIEADLAFFPGVIAQRAILKHQKSVSTNISQMPLAYTNIATFYSRIREVIAVYPFLFETLCILSKVRISEKDENSILIDSEGQYMLISDEITIPAKLKWILYTKCDFHNVCGIFRKEKFYPLGIFIENDYILL